MNIEEINNTITELENSNTTFSVCAKLADLYTIRDHYIADEVVSEYADILPTYKKYCEVKTKFQMHDIPQSVVEDYLNRVCKEICEFLTTLYSNTDTPVEREVIKAYLKDFAEHITL